MRSSLEAATYTSPETVTTLAAFKFTGLGIFLFFFFHQDEDKSKDVEDDAFGEPSPTINTSRPLLLSVLKPADVSLLAIEEEEEEEEEDDVDDGRKMVTAIGLIQQQQQQQFDAAETYPRSNRFEANDDDTNTNNNSFLQIGSPATVMSPVFGQMAKSPEQPWILGSQSLPKTEMWTCLRNQEEEEEKKIKTTATITTSTTAKRTTGR